MLAALKTICAIDGRRLFPVTASKVPFSGARPGNPEWSWKTEHFTEEELREHVNKGRNLALSPASLGLWVADIDRGTEEAWDLLVERFEAPAAWVRTRRGYHAYYRLPADPSLTVRNRKWALGSAGGELRGHTGYVVAWDLPAVAALLESLDDHQPISPFPGLVEDRLALVADNTRPVDATEPSVRLVEAVKHLTPDVLGSTPDYETWITLGQAIHQETGGHPAGFDLWDTFSMQFDNYPSGEEPSTAQKWASFHAGRADGVAGGTVYQLAEEHGWIEDVTDDFDNLDEDSSNEENPRNEEDSSEPAPKKAKERVRPLVRDKRIWTLRRILRALRVRVRYNTRREMNEVSDDGSPWFEPTDGYTAMLRERIAENYLYQATGSNKSPEFLTFGKETFHDFLDGLAWENSVDPFFEWLTGLPEWDGEERLSRWIETCWTLSQQYDIELARWASRFIFLGAIQRCFQPGCELDEMPILIGRGGLGKTKSLKFILPPEQQFNWFSDRFDFLAKERDMAEKMLGKVIVEASEMAGIRKAMNTHIKSAISGSAETVRLAYRRNPVTLVRKCVIVGTGDNEDLLPNDPNLRRFVPIVISTGEPRKVFKYIAKNRLQLWAEALTMYREGMEARLPRELRPAQEEVAEVYRGRDEAIEDLVARLPNSQDNRGFSLKDLMEATDCDIRFQKAFTVELRRHRWKRTKVRFDDKTTWRWVPPPDWSPTEPLSIDPDFSGDSSSDFENLDDSPL